MMNSKAVFAGWLASDHFCQSVDNVSAEEYNFNEPKKRLLAAEKRNILSYFGLHRTGTTS